MALLTLKWPSASGRVTQVSRGGHCGVTRADIPRRRPLSSTIAQGRRQEKRQEKPRDMTTSMWSTTKTMAVSGSKPKFQYQPKPSPPQGRHRSEQRRSSQQGPKSMGTNAGPATAVQPEKPRSVQQPQTQPLCATPKPETSSENVNANAFSVPSIVREDAAKAVLRLLSTDGCPAGAHEALSRSGSAPSSSALASANPAGAICFSSRRPTNEKPSLPAARIKMGCSTSEPEGNFFKTTRSCWDESRDKIDTPVDAATLPARCSSAPTTGNKAARSTVSEEQQKNEPFPQRSGSNGLASGSVLPLLSPEQELLSKGMKTRNKRLVPLRRRKSDVVGGSVRARNTNNDTSSSITRAPTSAGSEPSVSKRRKSAPGLRSPDTSRPSTTCSSKTARERASSGRISRSSDSATGVVADQGHLKARLRVMEWKRRRAEQIKAQEEEQASLEQLQRAEAETEAARKLAAARAEEAERRIVAERDSTADAARAAESAEKRAKASRQRERRRAEVYAINAVMRTAFEREFEAYSLEQKTRSSTSRVAGPASPDTPLAKNEQPPQQSGKVPDC